MHAPRFLSFRLTPSLATLALVLPASALAQSDDSSSSRRTPAADAAARSALATFQRVNAPAMDRQLTARDLIGAEVYDAAGEKIGAIVDLGITTAQTKELARALHDETAAGATPARSAPWRVQAETRVFIAARGVFGAGNNLVTVPTSHLRFNAEARRLELAVPRAALLALPASPDDDDLSRQAAAPPRDDAGPDGELALSDEARKVQAAIKSDATTSEFAQSVSVRAAGDAVQINGFVANLNQRQLILELARNTTAAEIEDNLKLRP